jgi:putative transposase
VLDAVKQLDAKGANHHSDRGFQYTMKSYVNLLDEQELKGKCLYRVIFFSPQNRKALSGKPDSATTARKLIAEHIDYYNNERIQKRIGNLPR